MFGTKNLYGSAIAEPFGGDVVAGDNQAVFQLWIAKLQCPLHSGILEAHTHALIHSNGGKNLSGFATNHIEFILVNLAVLSKELERSQRSLPEGLRPSRRLKAVISRRSWG